MVCGTVPRHSTSSARRGAIFLRLAFISFGSEVGPIDGEGSKVYRMVKYFILLKQHYEGH